MRLPAHVLLLAGNMLEQLPKYLLLVVLAAAPLSGCGYMTQNGRQQMAYQRYVRKQSGKRMKMQKKLKPPRMPLTPGPSDNHINTEVSDAPQSVTAGESQTRE